MGLSNKEAEKAYRSLCEIARGVGLDWVVVQVEGRVELGKTSIEKVPVRMGGKTDAEETWQIEEEGGRGGKGRPAEYVVAEEYSQVERLGLLIDALLVAVPMVHQVARATLAEIGEFGSIDELEFVDDMPERVGNVIHVNDLDDRDEAVGRVQRLLDKLKVEIRDA